jgi:uncharacterized cupin superfamily protein
MDYINFIIGIEDGSLTEEEFYDQAQGFVDSGIWKSLQGSWQRMVYAWAEQGLVTL